MKNSLLIAALLFFSSLCFGQTSSYIGGCVNSAASATSTNCASSPSSTAGNIIYVVSKVEDSTGGATPTFTTSSGPACTWQAVIPSTHSASGFDTASAVCLLPTSGAETPQVSWSGGAVSTGFIDIAVGEESSTTGWNSILKDGTPSVSVNVATSGNCLTGTVTTADSNDLIIANCENFNFAETWGALTGWTNRATSSRNTVAWYDQQSSSASSYGTTINLPTPDASVGMVAAFALGGKANIWINTTAGTCTRSASLVAYSSTTACGSMAAAQAIASAGDTIVMKNGTYGGQSLSANGTASAVSYFAETPSSCQGKAAVAATCTGSVLLGSGCTAAANGNSISISIDHVHIFGLISTGSGETRCGLDINNHSAVDILVDGFSGKSLFASSSGTTIQHGDFGAFNACNGYNGSGCNAGSDCDTEDATRFWGDPAPTNDKLLNNYIHDVSAPPDGVCGGGSGIPHVDMLQVFQSSGTASNIVIDGNLFINPGGDSNMQWGGGGLSNITIQNNYLGSPTCCNSIAFGQASPCTGLVFRNNVVDNAYDLVNNGTCSGSIDISNNIILQSISGCLVAGGTVTGGNNIFHAGSSTCGTSVKTCTPTWLNGAPASGNGYDFRLSPSDTCALNTGNGSDFAATDFYGTTRPQGTSPDIGAFEFVSGNPATHPAPAVGLFARGQASVSGSFTVR